MRRAPVYPRSLRSRTFCVTEGIARAAPFALIVVFLIPMVAASGPPFLPYEPARPDELSVVPRDWEEVRRDAGPVIDVEGVPRAPHQGKQSGVGYRVHGDIAAMEGTFTLGPVNGTPKPVFNTGFRLHRVEFDPPLVLADDTILRGVFPASLDWVEQGPIVTGGHRPSLGYGFWAHVPLPDRDGWSPSQGGNTSNDRGDNGTPGGNETGVLLQWSVGFHDDPQDDLMVHLTSPANAHVTMHAEVGKRAVDEETWERLHDTKATFSFLFDYAGSQRGVTVTGPEALQVQGVYLIQSERAATLRVLNTSQPQVSYPPAPGRPAPGAVERVLNAPLTVNATVNVAGQKVSTLYPNEPFARQAQIRVELGYLMDLPDPDDTPQPTQVTGTPGPPVLAIILLVVVFAVIHLSSRTDRER